MNQLCVRIALIGAALCCNAGAQTKEYIRLNGRVVAIENPVSANFSIGASAASATVVRNGSTPITITVTPVNGFTGAVTLSMGSLPVGVTAAFNPSPVTVTSGSITSVLTLSANATATTGTVAITVTGASTSPVLSQSTSVNLTTALAPDFSLSGLINQTITAGSSGSQTVTVTPLNGFTGLVDLVASGLPPGVTAPGTSANVAGGPVNGTLTLTATAGASLGTVTITVTGTNAALSLTRTATFQLTVNATPMFTLSAPTGGSVVAGSSGSFGVSTSATGGFNSQVTFSLTGMPVGVTSGFAPAFVTGSGSSVMTVTVGGSVSPGNYAGTITASSTTPAITKTGAFTLTVSAAQQSLSGAGVNPSNGSEVTVTAVASDTTGAAHILYVELNFSTSLNSNTFVAGQACRFRATRASAGVYTMSIENANGDGSIYDYRTIGPTGSISNGACALDMAQSSVVESGNTWTISTKVRSLTMSGTRYLRGLTGDDATASLPQPYTYLNASWSVPTPPTVTFTNSQGISPPVIYSSFNVTVTMSAANLGTGVITMNLVQTGDGSISPLSGTNPMTLVYTAGNSGEDRDILIRGLVCTATCAANGSNVTQELFYTLRVRSSTSSPPSLNFVNPFTGSSLNPSPLNSNVTANGTATTFLSFGIKNTPYPAAQCTYYPASLCTPIQNLSLNINSTFTESALVQDRANGCRLRVNVFAGGSPPGYYFFLLNDAGDYENGFLWTPAYGGGSTIENSQCRLNILSSAGSYADWPTNDNTTLGIGLQYVFKTPFVGKRYLFMMGNRNSGDWSGWQYRGFLNMQ